MTLSLPCPIIALRNLELGRNVVVPETNQGWTTGFAPAAVEARKPLLGAFPLNAQSADSAVLTALSAGACTVTARGAEGATGIALVEIYDANGIESPPLSP